MESGGERYAKYALTLIRVSFFSVDAAPSRWQVRDREHA